LTTILDDYSEIDEVSKDEAIDKLVGIISNRVDFVLNKDTCGDILDISKKWINSIDRK
jgi:hypothetical protein